MATGHLHIAIALLILTGLHDLLDGPVAKAAGTASVRGAFFDSVTDRVADALLMGGVAWYLIDRHEGHLAVLPLAVLGVTALVSYERAKAESLGLSAKGGLMERAERMILLGIGFLDSAFVVPVLWVMLVLITLTAVARFVKVWNEASGKDVAVRRRVVAWREGRVDSRWRSWREGSAVPAWPGRAEDRRPRRPLAGPAPGVAEQSLRPHAAGPATGVGGAARSGSTGAGSRGGDGGAADGSGRTARPGGAPRPSRRPLSEPVAEGLWRGGLRARRRHGAPRRPI